MNESTTDTMTQTSPSKLGGKYLTFRLKEETYGLQILQVQEIIGLMNITRLPNSPAYMRGIINLRGKVIPVMDLRLRFGLEKQGDQKTTCIIVIQISRNEELITVGILVDQVSEVLDIQEMEIEDVPNMGTEPEMNFVVGIGKVSEKVVLLLETQKILDKDKMDFLKDLNPDSPYPKTQIPKGEA